MKPLVSTSCVLPLAAAAVVPGIADDSMRAAARLCRADVRKTNTNPENGPRPLNGGSSSPSLTFDTNGIALLRAPAKVNTIQQGERV
jgi:hypothetical protein